MRQDKQGGFGSSPHGTPSLGRESPAEVVCRGEGCGKPRSGKAGGVSRGPGGLHGVLGNDGQVLPVLFLRLQTPVGGQKSAEQSD